MADTTRYDAFVSAAAAAYNVPAAWIKAVIGTETSFDTIRKPTFEPAVNEYSYGPMQILLSTAHALGFELTAEQLAEPATNIKVGAAYLASLRTRIGDDFARIYSAYNSGSPDRWLTSTQVKANVTRALGWLGTFVSSATGEDGAPGLLLVGLLAGAWLLFRGKQR